MASAGAEGDVRLLAGAPGPATPGPVGYPGLFHAADAAAVATQRQHFAIEAVQLALNPVAAALALLVSFRLLPLPSAFLTAVSTVLIVLILWVSRAVRLDQRWYECRGAAEEVRGLTWRYVMELEPFPPAAEAPEATFAAALDRVLQGGRELRGILARHALVLTGAATPEMQGLRRAPLDDRVARYLAERLRPELAWYAATAARRARADRRWFALLVVVQLAAVVAAIMLAAGLSTAAGRAPGLEDTVPLLTALGAAAMGWSRSRRNGDLAASYAASAQALAGLESSCPAGGEGRRAWAERVERALAAEHDLWRRTR